MSGVFATNWCISVAVFVDRSNTILRQMLFLPMRVFSLSSSIIESGIVAYVFFVIFCSGLFCVDCVMKKKRRDKKNKKKKGEAKKKISKKKVEKKFFSKKISKKKKIQI